MKNTDLDACFKALAAPIRRKFLDHISAHPGVDVAGLSETVTVSRYAVMQHLNVLEQSGLVESQRDGRRRRLHAKPAVLQAFHSAWWAPRLDLSDKDLSPPAVQVDAPVVPSPVEVPAASRPDRDEEIPERPTESSTGFGMDWLFESVER